MGIHCRNALAEAEAAAMDASSAVQSAAAAAEKAADGLAAVAQQEQQLRERLEELQAEQQDKEQAVQVRAPSPITRSKTYHIKFDSSDAGDPLASTSGEQECVTVPSSCISVLLSKTAPASTVGE